MGSGEVDSDRVGESGGQEDDGVVDRDALLRYPGCDDAFRANLGRPERS